MQMTARKFTGPDIFQEMKDEEYLYWASIPASESFAVGHQMSVEGYRAYGYTADGRELKQLLVALNAHDVRYLIIGGYAVFVHGQPRMTKDLDIFIESSPANALATFKALAAFGAPLKQFTVADFADGKTGASFGNPPICFDVLQKIDGVNFASAYANSMAFLIDGDLPTRYISADDLVTNKLASGRPQDLADVDAILNRRKASAKRDHSSALAPPGM